MNNLKINTKNKILCRVAHLLIGVLCALSPLNLSANESQIFHHLTTEDGLAHTDATCTLEDSDGFIWIGTSSGLQCYDGYELRTYDYFENFPQRIIRNLENRITSIAELDNVLLVGSKSGLHIFDKKRRKYIHSTFTSGSNKTKIDLPIVDIVVDKQNYIWIRATNQVSVSQMYVCFYDSAMQQVNVMQQFKQKLLNYAIQQINCMIASKEGVWVIFSDSTIFHIIIKDQVAKLVHSYNINEITGKSRQIRGAGYAQNKLYILCQDRLYGFNVNNKSDTINANTHNTRLFKNSLKYLKYKNGRLAIDKTGRLWCAHKNGIAEINSPFGEFKYKLHSNSMSDVNSLSTNFISNTYVDSNNHIWITTWGGGVNYIDARPKQFNIIQHDPNNPKSINDSFVKAMERDSQGYLWVATQNYGVDRYDFNKRQVVESYSAERYMDNDYAIKEVKITDDCRHLYVGALNGLYVIDRKMGRSATLFGETNARLLNKSIQIYALDIDKYNNLWVATWKDGVYVIRHNERECKILAHINKMSSGVKLTSNTITDIKCADDKVWITTDNGVNLVSFNEKTEILSNMLYAADRNNSASMSNNFTSCVAIESDSVVWVGTLGGGLNRLTILPTQKPKNINYQIGRYESENFTAQNGLQSNDVESVLLDADGNVWMSGYGITKLEYPSRRITTFDANDGLQSNSFKIGSANIDKFGTLYFGGLKGLNFFNPKHIRPESERGHLVFSSFSLHNKGEGKDNDPTKGIFINYLDNLKLKYNQNDFTIEFSALNFFPTNKVRFRYRMGGVSSDWQYTTHNYNRVSYANLNYGDYTFIAQVSFDNGATWKSSNIRTLGIRVDPPWWWSWWSRVIYALIILATILVIFLQYRQHTIVKHQLAIKDLEKKRNEENTQLRLQFFTNISHEFRTPLTIIISAIERLSELNLDEAQANLAHSVERNAQRMHSLISQLMDFRKTDTKRDVIRAKHEDITPYIRSIVSEFKLWSAKKGIVLKYTEQQSVAMWFDREKITKILWNLISNALKYTENGGEISVDISRGSYSSIKPYFGATAYFECDKAMKECLIINVRDTGIGITADSLDKIFDRYFQISSKTSLHLGSGIGLAVARSMVLSHNGNLIVSSKREIGTEFIVAIPLDASYIPEENRELSCDFDVNEYLSNEYLDLDLEKAFEPVDQSDDSINSMLIVEDNVDLLSILYNHYSRYYRVFTASDGEEGLAMCQKHFPDIILSDVMMPKMDGIEMCERIRENLQTTSTPIILLTAKNEVEGQISGLESGADLYMSKPFSTQVLDLHVKRFLSYKDVRAITPENVEEIDESTEESTEAEDENPRERIVEQKDKEFIDRFTELMLANLDNSEYSVNSLCSDLAIGRTRLYTKVKDITGESLGDLIRDIRITKAAELLTTTDKNITEVIYEVGIGSNSHFSKAFKQRYGVTPSDYARGKRKE